MAIADSGVYGPYVPADRLWRILAEYLDRWGLTRNELATELEAHSKVSKDAWLRRFYSWSSGETASVRFPVADKVLTALDLTDKWYTELNDIYERAA